MGQERRRHPRIITNHLTTVFVPAPDGAGPEEIVGRTIDLSQGGALLETAGGPAEGMSVTVSIAVEDQLLEIVGMVVRRTPLGEGFYEVAIAFGPMAFGTPEQIELVRTKLLGGKA
jgi:hypothetical protein